MPQNDNAEPKSLSIAEQMQQALSNKNDDTVITNKSKQVEQDSNSKDVDDTTTDEVDDTTQEQEAEGQDTDDQLEDESNVDNGDNDSESSGDDEAGEPSIFSEIETILGYNVDSEESFEESTEGMAKYIDHHRTVAKQEAILNFEETLKTQHPQAYEAMLYSMQGGNPADLFKGSSEINEFDPSNENQHKEILKQYYSSKGLDESSIDMLITQNEDMGKLQEMAKKTFETMSSERDKEKEAMMLANAEKVKQQKEQDNQFVTSLNDIVNKGVLNNFTVPKADIPKFQEWILNEKVQYDGKGGYQLAFPLAGESAEEVLQAAFLLYKKGDIGKLIQRKAETNRIKGLKKVAQGGSKSATAKSGNGQTKKLNRIEEFQRQLGKR